MVGGGGVGGVGGGGAPIVPDAELSSVLPFFFPPGSPRRSSAGPRRGACERAQTGRAGGGVDVDAGRLGSPSPSCRCLGPSRSRAGAAAAGSEKTGVAVVGRGPSVARSAPCACTCRARTCRACTCRTCTCPGGGLDALLPPRPVALSVRTGPPPLGLYP